MIFCWKMWILEPPGVPRRLARSTLWGDGFLQFRLQKCNISIGFLRFCKIVSVCPQWRSHLKVTFFIIIITTVWFKCIFICICGEGLFTNSSTRRRWHKLKIYAAADSKRFAHSAAPVQWAKKQAQQLTTKSWVPWSWTGIWTSTLFYRLDIFCAVLGDQLPSGYFL